MDKGSVFDVRLNKNCIELVPLEVTEKVFTEKEYQKMEALYEEEKGSAVVVDDAFIEGLGK